MRYETPVKSRFRKALTEAFPNKGQIDLVAADASEEIKKQWKSYVTSEPTPENAILQLIDWAESQQCLLRLLESALESNRKHPELQTVAALLRPLLEPFRELGAEVGQVERVLFKRSSFEDVGPWLDKLARVRRAICRVEPQPIHKSKIGYGTGFLVAPDLVVTNWHVAEQFWSKDDLAKQVVFRFGCENDNEQRELPGEEFRLSLDWSLPTSPVSECDFALLRLNRAATGGQGQKREYLTFTEEHVFETSEPLMILQHPDAKPLKLALGSLKTIDLPRHIWYEVNTQGGSSGAPCLTQNLDLVGIHHFGTDAKNRGVVTSAILPKIRAFLTPPATRTASLAGSPEALDHPDPRFVTFPREQAPPNDLLAVIQQYDALVIPTRRDDPTPRQVPVLAGQMTAFPLEDYSLTDNFVLSESPGSRLAGILALTRRPVARYLPWLSERVAVETPFAGQRAAQAILEAAITLPVDDLESVSRAAGTAVRWIAGTIPPTASVAFGVRSRWRGGRWNCSRRRPRGSIGAWPSRPLRVAGPHHLKVPNHDARRAVRGSLEDLLRWVHQAVPGAVAADPAG